ncbi:hypothetical protein [Streptomyces sp. NPDC046805]|uniref:hypothetical protein n=1 Tax=Streptomyces sp. NPDC046805 TaxID=3155134 RepID=UPI0033D491B9
MERRFVKLLHKQAKNGGGAVDRRDGAAIVAAYDEPGQLAALLCMTSAQVRPAFATILVGASIRQTVRLCGL